jgi:prolyl-tRNA synthetase
MVEYKARQDAESQDINLSNIFELLVNNIRNA